MNYKNFERSIEYKSVIDYSDKSYDAQNRAVVLSMHGDIYINGRAYTVFLTYHLNSKEKLSLYHNSFLSLNDGLDYTIMGPAPVMMSTKPFELKRGKGQVSFEKALAKISEDYGLSKSLGMNIGTDLYSDATEYFYEWKNKEIEKVCPTKKPFDFKLNTVSYCGVECVMHATLTHGDNYDVTIKLFPKSKHWYLGLNTWDLVGDVAVEVVDVCRFTTPYKDLQPKINFHFKGLMENFPRFKGMLADMLDEQSKNWKNWYIKNHVNGTFEAPQDFKITWSKYDSELHIEYINFNIKDYSFTVEYHFKSADCDLRGKYKGDKIAFIHYECGKGRLERNGDESTIIKLYTPIDIGYEESCDKLRDFIVEKTGLDKETVDYKIIAALNQRVDIDTNDYLEHYSHLTQFIYEDKCGHLKGDWTYKIIAGWSKEKLDEIIKNYTYRKPPSTIGAYLINNGLVNEISVKVTCDFKPLVDIRVQNDNDPEILAVLKSVAHTRTHYTLFKENFENFLTKTFSDEIIRLPESVDKILNELNATIPQRKVIADAFKKL